MNTKNDLAYSFLDFFLNRYRAHHSIINAQEVSDNCLDFDIHNNEFTLESLSLIQDIYFKSIGFEIALLSTATVDNFRLRTYRHLSGSEVQLMFFKENYFGFFIEQRENSSQRDLRLKINNLKGNF